MYMFIYIYICICICIYTYTHIHTGGGGVGGIGTKGGVVAEMHGGQATLAKRKRPDSPPTKEKVRTHE